MNSGYDKIYKFAGLLKNLVDTKPIDHAVLAKLRRGIGDSFDEVSPDFPSWLMDCVEDPQHYGKFALVGSLFAHHRLPSEESESLGKIFSKHKGSDSLEKRFKSLLEARGDELIKRLREIVGLSKSQEIPIHYGRLLWDIVNWDNPEQAVQFRWARDYWLDPAVYEQRKEEVENEWENEKASAEGKAKEQQNSSPGELRARIFTKYLQDLKGQKNRAALAHLRRGLDKPQGTIDMLPYVAPFLPEDRREYPAYFLIAALFALHPLYTEENYHDMGLVFRLLAGKKPTKEATQSLQRRFTALLDADRRDLANHLRQVVSAANSAKTQIPINYRQLLLDAIEWDNRSKRVQRRWAKSFFFDPKSTA